MRKVHEYTLTDARSHIVLHEGARVLAFQSQHAYPTIWVEEDTDAKKVTVTFDMVATGETAPGDGEYIGTAQFGALVFHLYRRRT